MEGADLGAQLEISAVANRSIALGVRPTKFESWRTDSIAEVILGESFNLSKVVFRHLENGRGNRSNIYLTYVKLKGKNQYSWEHRGYQTNSDGVGCCFSQNCKCRYMNMRASINNTLDVYEQMTNPVDLKCNMRILDRKQNDLHMDSSVS